MHRHWVQFTLACRGYEKHNCHNKPQIGNGLECEWRHAQKRWAENLEILKQRSVEFYCRPVELGTRLGSVQLGVDFGHVKSWSLVKAMVLRSWSLIMEFCGSLLTESLKTTRCAKCLSFVSIVWYERLLRIVSLSPHVEELNSEVKKLINVCTWTTESPVYLSLPIVLMCCITVVTEMIIVGIQHQVRYPNWNYSMPLIFHPDYQYIRYIWYIIYSMYSISYNAKNLIHHAIWVSYWIFSLPFASSNLTPNFHHLFWSITL